MAQVSSTSTRIELLQTMFKIAIRIQIISNRGRRTALWGQRCRQSSAHIAF